MDKEKLLELLLKTPELITKETIDLFVGKYKKLIYTILEYLLDIYKDYADNTELPKAVAKSAKNNYDAYIDAGFTPDQAMAILLRNTSAQSISAMQSLSKSLSTIATNLNK